MKLLLHAGPMKTGSTAFQELLVLNSSQLEQCGIRFRHLRRQELDDLEAVVEAEQRRGWPRVLLLSHECLCRVDPQRLKAALHLVPVPAEAVLVARPLREVYPSLYLQNLKGHVMRTSSYEEFLQEQIDRDRRPELATRGQVFRYAFLEEQMQAAGCAVQWVSYARSSLLDDLVAWLAHNADAAEMLRALKPLPMPSGVSPRRSLDGTVVEIARLMNERCRAGTLSPEDRDRFLVALLNSSDRIRSQRQGLDSFRENHADQLDALDHELNGDFWRQRAMHPTPWDPT
ncbi:hypothetical protein [Synechococcus sp. A15-28]|uniref:hypothetical protein n=1 Tax=Synechococcus sp. A15-28 TaxID=1050638 RepID=UPI0016476248|nr:hypothetical protein [Synechococcus sp. A15-28]QNI41171.1 hypothetical protein SynA1528_00123 [Synechococcus sp. A15-28]